VSQRRRPARQHSDPVLQIGEPSTSEELDGFAERYAIVLPPAWKHWSRRNGWVRQTQRGWELLGLRTAPSGLDVPAMLAGIRFTVPGFPSDLLPIEWLPERQLACVRLDGSTDPHVVIVDLDDPETWTGEQPPLDRFSIYAEEFSAQAHALKRITKFLADQQRLVATGRRAADQAPRPDDWRVYRFCSQNVVVAIVLLRFDRDHNALCVGDCLITDLSRLDPDAPARAVCTLLLAEAYRAGGDLTIRFTKARNAAATAPVPRQIVRWAARAGVPLDGPQGLIPADRALQLFISSVQISAALTKRLRDLPHASAAAVCHGIANGLWPAMAVEAILAWSHDPSAVLKGATDPLDRARYAADLLDAREGLLIASLVRRIAAGPQSTESKLDVEDAQVPVDVTIHPDHTCTLAATTLNVADWATDGAEPSPGNTLRLTVADAELDQLPDAVGEALLRLPAGGAVLCPKDLQSLDEAVRANLYRVAREAGVALLAAPEYTPSLAMRAADTLARARTARQ
jgi:hypothetical protein